jgi:lipooligosaccharide transport system ATP-binding protein
MVWEKLTYLKTRGITILLTTHNMEEAAYLCDRLVIMDLGRILVEGSPDELVQEHAAAEVIQIRVPEAERREFAEKLRGDGVEVEETGDGVMLFGEDGRLAKIESALDGMLVTRRPGNLEDVFLRLTGRVLRDQ